MTLLTINTHTESTAQYQKDVVEITLFITLTEYLCGCSFFHLFFRIYFFKKSKQKTVPKEIVAGPPLLVRQRCAHSVGGLLVIAVYDCFKGAAEL